MGDEWDGLREIDEKELIDLCLDEEEVVRIIDQDEVIIYDEIVWDQENTRLKKEGIVLSETEKSILIMLDQSIPLYQIAEVKKTGEEELRKCFCELCTRLCTKNQKEAFRRAEELGLL